MGTQLEKRRDAGLARRRRAIAEADAAHQLREPVIGALELSRQGETTVQVGVDRQRGRAPGHARQGMAERVECGTHQLRMEGVRDAQRLAGDALRRETRNYRRHRLGRARDHALRRRIHRGDAHGARRGRDRLRHVVLGRRHRRHRSAGGQRLHHAAPCGDQRGGLLEREHAGDAGGDVLADAVAQERCRANAPGPPHLGERPFHGEERGLAELGPVDALLAGALGMQHLEERGRHVRPQRLGAAVERTAKRGLAAIQRAAHARVLRSLARQEEGHPQVLARRPLAAVQGPAAGRGLLLAPRRALQSGAQVRGAIGHDRDATAQVRAAGGGACTEIARARLVGWRDRRRIAGDELVERGIVGRGDAQHVRPRRFRRVRAGARRQVGRRLEHDVGVRADEAERAHARQAPFAPRGPGARGCGQAERHAIPFDHRAGLRDDQCGATWARCSESTALMRPAMPAAASRCPMLAFTEPRYSGLPGGSPCAEHRAPAPAPRSDRPSGVPVPCAST